MNIYASSHASFPALILLNRHNNYNHSFPINFNYNHYVYSDYLVSSVPAIAHIIRYCDIIATVKIKDLYNI